MTLFRATTAAVLSAMSGLVLLASVEVAAAPTTPTTPNAQMPSQTGPAPIPNPSFRAPLLLPPPPQVDDIAVPQADDPDDPDAPEDFPWSEPIGELAGDPAHVQPVVVNCGPMMVCCFDFENPDTCQQFVDALAERWACTGGAGSAVCIHPNSPVN